MVSDKELVRHIYRLFRLYERIEGQAARGELSDRKSVV